MDDLEQAYIELAKTCEKCGHYDWVHPCTGYREFQITIPLPFGFKALIYRKCRCKEAVI